MKRAAISNIEEALGQSQKLGCPEEMKFGSFSKNRKIKQGLTLRQILQEIKKETATGELYVKVWAVKLY